MADQVVTVRMQAVDETGPGTASAEGNFKKVDAAASGAAENVKKIGTAATEAGNVSSGPLSKLSGALGDIGKMAAGFAVGNIAMQLGQGLQQQISGSIQQAQEFTGAVKSLQMITGGTPEQLSGVVAAFERFGVSSQQASTSLGIFSRQLQKTPVDMEELGSGLDANGKPLKGFADVMHDLGVNTEDTSGKTRPMIDVLMQTADKFKEMGKGTEATADAMTMFGRSGKAMLPLLMQGSEGIKEAADTAAKYGMQLTTENMAQVKDFGMANKDLGEAMNGLKLQLGLALMPALAALAHVGATVAQTFNQILMPVIKALGSLIMWMVGTAQNLVSAFMNLYPPLQIVGGAFQWVQDNMDNFHDAWNALVEALTGDAGAMGVVYDMIRKVFGDSVADQLQPFLQWFMTAIPLIKDAWNAIVEAFSGTPGALGIVDDVIRKVFGDDAANAIEPFLQKVMDIIPIFQDAGRAIVAAFSGTPGALGIVGDAIRKVFGDQAADAVQPFLEILMNLIGQFNQVRDAVMDLWAKFQADPFGTLKEALQGLSPAMDSMSDAWKTLGDLWDQFWPHPITDIATDILTLGQNVGQAVENVTGKTSLLEVATSALSLAWDVIKGALNLAAAAFDALVHAIDNTTKFIKEHQSVQAILVGILGAVTAALVLVGIQMAINAGLALAQAIATGAMSAAQGVAAIATNVLAIAQGALNLVMSANPIALVVIAIAGLVAGLIWAYNNIQPFHDAVDAAWASIQQFGQAIGDWLGPKLTQLGELFNQLGTFVSENGDTIKTVLEVALLGPMGLVLAAWQNDWGGIQEKVQGFVDWFTQIPQQIQTGLDQIGAAFSTLGQKIHDALANIKIDIGPLHWDANGMHTDPINLPGVSLPGSGGGGGGGGGTTDDTGGGAAGALAFQGGGWLREPVRGVGPSGTRYTLHANEFVSPAGPLSQAASLAHSGGGGGGVTLNVAAGAVQISGANGPSEDWAAAADGLWDDLYAKLSRALDNRVQGVGAPG